MPNVGGVKPLIPVLPPSPSLDMPFFSGGTTLHNNNNNNNDNGTSLERSYSNSQSSLTSGKTSTESSHTLVSVSSYTAAHPISMKQRKTPSPGPGSGQRGGGGRTPPAYPPPQESLPLPPTSGAGGGAGSAIVRSPSPLSEEIQPYHSSSSSSTSAAAAVQLQGLGLGPVHRSVAEGQHSVRSVSTPTPTLQHRVAPNPSTGRARQQPEVHVIASSFQTRDGDVSGGGSGAARPIHRDLPPIITTPAVPNYQDRVAGSQQQQLPPRSVSLSNPHRGQQVSGTSSSASGGASGRKLPAPPALELKALNNSYQRQFHSPQLLSPGMGMGMISPGFSPTNVVVDSLIEEMHDEEEHGKDRPTAGGEGDDGTPVRKTSILNRPRPRASSRSSSYRADPLSRTPTPQQATFSPGIHDPNLFANMQQHQQQDGQQHIATNPYYRPCIQLTDVIMHEGVQKALLPCLSIASFLALLSAFDKRWRRCISGEMVGKWIVREWSLNLGPDVVWPGLGVWEGFRECLAQLVQGGPSC
ncbi:hypothetical protein QFC22_003744 [Naganishia vaughanmartiniae]|uniref:Uncharacterized protein n=1 Tax=Naganishia vaughanmartiniae TaxID=1424756 RepID=A0ACC2X904_9TREE|nr:hypothetical protein QFC22_003744 [Naganishia vaughanmartiniae]